MHPACSRPGDGARRSFALTLAVLLGAMSAGGAGADALSIGDAYTGAQTMGEAGAVAGSSATPPTQSDPPSMDGPPPDARSTEAGMAVLVEHVVIPGERLQEIAARHGVSAESIVADNSLDSDRPRLRVGQSLRVHALHVPPPRQRITYIVRFGDNWRTIAARHDIEQSLLRRWNRDVPRTFEAGQELTLWVDADVKPVDTGGLGLDVDRTGLGLQPVAPGAQSAGQPTRGRLLSGVRLPDNPALYTIRRPDFAWGASHTVDNLQLGLAKFRQHSGFGGRIIVSDMSRPRGRAFGGHRSHQSGRDVDIWLPVKAERDMPEGDLRAAAAAGPGDVDWPATWQLVKALVRTGEVQYIFLARSRQRLLYRAARAEGEDVNLLGEVMQYPRRAQTAIVRHSERHHKHMHVRFRCAAGDRRCR